jgi:hypothetical protein
MLSESSSKRRKMNKQKRTSVRHYASPFHSAPSHNITKVITRHAWHRGSINERNRGAISITTCKSKTTTINTHNIIK